MLVVLAKIQRKREGLTNGKKERIHKILITKDIHVFAIWLARANATDPHCTEWSGAGLVRRL